MTTQLNRRQALKLFGAAGLTLYLSRLAPASAWATVDDALTKISPIDRTLPEVASAQWYSDYPETAHKILWNKADYLAALKPESLKPSEHAPLVIVGGGISGLVSAYLLREYSPIILEQAPRFGGNAKGQSFHGVDYSIGAAYFINPEEGSDIKKVLTELGLSKNWKVKSDEDPVEIKGTVYKNFWAGEVFKEGSAEKAQCLKLASYFKKVNDGSDVLYPDIPYSDEKVEAYVKELDRVSFKSHIEKIAGGPLASEIETLIEQYCWSSMGASASEVGAASALNFYASEFGEMVPMPGGNAAVAERALQRLHAKLPANNFRPSSLVFNVEVQGKKATISYLDANGAVKTISTDALIMACPKFVVGKVLADIEPERVKAFQRLKYRSYVVANVCLRGGEEALFYDLYTLGEGKLVANDAKTNSDKRKVTDVIYATYAKANKNYTVLTLYRGIPNDGARAQLLGPDSYAQYRTEFENQIHQEILPLLKIDPKRIVDLRLARWGHPIPVASTGLIAEGVTDRIRAPFKDRVFFVEQDNWALPAFETSFSEAIYWAPKVEKLLQRR